MSGGEALLPCPFCGGNDLTKLMTLRDGSSSVGCRGCGSSGPAVTGRRHGKSTDCWDPCNEDIAAWNRRTPAPEAAGGEARSPEGAERRIELILGYVAEAARWVSGLRNDDMPMLVMDADHVEELLVATMLLAGTDHNDAARDFAAKSSRLAAAIDRLVRIEGVALAAQDGEREYRCACHGGAADGRCGDCGNPCSPFRTQDGERPAGEERRTVQRRQGERREPDSELTKHIEKYGAMGDGFIAESTRVGTDRRIATEDRRK